MLTTPLFSVEITIPFLAVLSSVDAVGLVVVAVPAAGVVAPVAGVVAATVPSPYTNVKPV